MKLVYSTPQDLYPILDSANKIFTHRKDDSGIETYDHQFFQTVQPKLYQSEVVMPPHLLAYEDGRLVGHIAICKTVLKMGAEALAVYGIGTVGVVKEYRGRGIMQAMMNRIHMDLAEANADLSELSGKRKRYSHFGYTTGGYGVDLTLFKEEFTDIPKKGYRFAEDGEWTPDEQELFCRLHKNQPIYTERDPALFRTILRSEKNRALKIYLGERCVGYCSVGSSYEYMTELEAESGIDILEVLGAYMQTFSLRKLTLRNFSPLWMARHPQILHLASATSLQEQERYHIFNYQHVLKAGLSVKHELQPLCPGSLVLRIQNYGTVSIRIGGEVQVEMSEQKADLELSEEEATHLFMGIPAFLPTYCTLPAFAASWFPLPIHYQALMERRPAEILGTPNLKVCEEKAYYKEPKI